MKLGQVYVTSILDEVPPLLYVLHKHTEDSVYLFPTEVYLPGLKISKEEFYSRFKPLDLILPLAFVKD